MKQSAVEWLASEIKNHIKMPSKHFDEILEQAKAMQKEQHIDTFEEGYNAGWCMAKEYADEPQIYDAEEYYNETFKTE
jgi:hypothetical protein